MIKFRHNMLFYKIFLCLAAILCIGTGISEYIGFAQDTVQTNENPQINSEKPKFSGWLTNNGSYRQRIYCMLNADGTPDWNFIVPIIVLCLCVIAAYLCIYRFWIKNYYRLEKQDRLQGMLSLGNIFLLCSISGYVLAVTMFYWPAYRLYIFSLSALSVCSWNFVFRHTKDIELALHSMRFQRMLTESVQLLSSGAEQINNSNQMLSSGISEQASAFQEIAGSLNQLDAQAKANAEKSAQVNQLVSEALVSVNTGAQQMSEMQNAMDGIRVFSEKIANITKLVEDISFQTNLLALNAAVEAARAGEAGAGFSVVAEEVRNLATRSAKAAKETGELLQGTMKNVENGISVSSRSAKTLEEILERISKVEIFVTEINTLTNEQASGLAQISQSMNQAEKVTQNNVANAEETSSISEHLQTQVEKIRESLGYSKGDGRKRTVRYEDSGKRAEDSMAKERKTERIPYTAKRGMKKQIVTPEQFIDPDQDDFGKY